MATIKNRASEILATEESKNIEMACIRESIRTIAYCGEDFSPSPSAMLYIIERLTNYQDILEGLQVEEEDKLNEYCNTEHCIHYAQGTCKFMNHADCPKYKKHD